MTGPTGPTGPTVWLPFPPEELEAVPPGLDVEVWDGRTELPGSRDAVRFYVPNYMTGGASTRVLDQLPALEVVQTLTAGVDDVLDHLPDGVTLCNARGVHDASTAELAVGLMVASLRRLPDFVLAQAEGRWKSQHAPSLADSRVLILGYGSIGAALERRLAGFEVDLVRVARSARDSPPVHGFGDLDRLLPTVDVVVLTVPLTDSTRGMVDVEFLARMKDGALLVNVARGPVVDTGALLAELSAGRLRAALDVTDPEPLPDGHPLWSAPGVLVVPHVGGNTTALKPRARRLVRDQLARWAAGEPLANVMVAGHRFPAVG